MTHSGESNSLQRVPSRIAGLDTILGGGFLEGGIYIIEGTPGAGKTILANEICFRHAAAGGHAAYITLLAESHARMLQHLEPLSFFDERVVSEAVYYTSAFRTLEEEGLKGLLALLRHEIKARRATVLVVDGLVVAEEFAQSNRELKKFIHELQAHAGAHRCTVLFLTTAGVRTVSAEHTMVDGVLELQDELFDVRSQRMLQVRKFRGARVIRGKHPFRITADGIKFFPRIEAIYSFPSRRDEPDAAKMTSGIASLDPMLHGGFPVGSSTGLVGPSGVGKTTIGLHFLSAATAQEPGLMLGFFEPPGRLRLKASRLGLPAGGHFDGEPVQIIWCPQGENILDELAHQLLDAVHSRGVKRLFLDGLGGLIESAANPERITRFFSCLSSELRANQVTTLFTLETRELLGGPLRLPLAGVSSLVENLIMLRYVERRAQLQRLISIAKVRDSDYEKALREFVITDRGVEIRAGFQGFEDVIMGVAHEGDTAPTPAVRGT